MKHKINKNVFRSQAKVISFEMINKSGWVDITGAVSSWHLNISRNFADVSSKRQEIENLSSNMIITIILSKSYAAFFLESDHQSILRTEFFAKCARMLMIKAKNIGR